MITLPSNSNYDLVAFRLSLFFFAPASAPNLHWVAIIVYTVLNLCRTLWMNLQASIINRSVAYPVSTHNALSWIDADTSDVPIQPLGNRLKLLSDFVFCKCLVYTYLACVFHMYFGYPNSWVFFVINRLNSIKQIQRSFAINVSTIIKIKSVCYVSG